MELPPAGRRGSFLLVALLLLISILLEQYLLVRLLPWLTDLGGVQPMIVFLDIPLRLPVIDWIPVGILFLFFYLVVIAPELSRHRQYWQQHTSLHSSPPPITSLGQKGWAVFTGWWLMLICLAAGGGLYYLVEDQLPKQVRCGPSRSATEDLATAAIHDYRCLGKASRNTRNHEAWRRHRFSWVDHRVGQ